MAENLELPNQSGGRSISDDSLAMTIVSLINAMKADFGHRYKSQFGSDDELRLYKRRLYAKLRGSDVDDIVAGYELFVDTVCEWPPTVPQLFEHVNIAKRKRLKKSDNQEEANFIAQLPAPAMQCDPTAMLAVAKNLSNGKNREDLLQMHNALINANVDKIRKIYADIEHACAVSNCSKPGVLSASTKGDSNFYCNEHFREYS